MGLLVPARAKGFSPCPAGGPSRSCQGQGIFALPRVFVRQGHEGFALGRAAQNG
ncbi:MAG: hypothetical protein IJU37_10575 [Desulfovibrio sp.]|nr:hypothetical protein [Desulfovibrio sp.]